MEKQMFTEYVLGFATGLKNGVPVLVMIRKTRAPFNDRFNGVGGKVEGDEDIHDAMVREFREETGVETSPDAWTHYATLSDNDYCVYTFVAELTPEQTENIRTMEAEPVELLTAMDMTTRADEIMPNVHWLLPMAYRLSVDDRPVVIVYPPRDTDG